MCLHYPVKKPNKEEILWYAYFFELSCGLSTIIPHWHWIVERHQFFYHCYHFWWARRYWKKIHDQTGWHSIRVLFQTRQCNAPCKKYIRTRFYSIYVQVDSFVLEQVSVKRIEKIFIRMEPKEELSSWHMDQDTKPKKKLPSWFLEHLELYDRESSTMYNFDCKRFDRNYV